MHNVALLGRVCCPGDVRPYRKVKRKVLGGKRRGKPGVIQLSRRLAWAQSR
jgi:hypothetical protein